MTFTTKDHPSGADLYAYFGKWSERKLSSEESDRIALHVKECADCFILGEIIQGDDETIDEELKRIPPLERDSQLEEMRARVIEKCLKRGKIDE